MSNEFVPYFMQEVLARANAGDGDACFDVAEYYYAQKAYAQAFDWYKKATQCPEPNPNAYFNLGYACQYGEGTEKDMFAAFEYYQKAAEQNLPQAMNNLAFFYESGIVVAQDQQKADELCRQATTLMNNLQTELYKAHRQYRQLQAQQAETQKQMEQARAEAVKADERTRKALLDLTDLQEKLRAADKDQQALQQLQSSTKAQLDAAQRASSKAAQAEQELRRQYQALNARYLALEQSGKQLEEENQARTQENLRRSAENRTLSARLQDAEDAAAQLQKALSLAESHRQSVKSAADAQSQKLVLQDETIEQLKQENSRLRTRKPFLRKRTVLCWLDIFVLGLLGCQLMSDWIMGDLDLYQTPLLLSCAVMIAVCILGWVLLKNKKFVPYGLLHWLSAMIVGLICLFAFTALEPMLPYLGLAAVLLWMGVVSFIGETV